VKKQKYREGKKEEKIMTNEKNKLSESKKNLCAEKNYANLMPNKIKYMILH
jgi:hypothetical protein